MGKTGRPFTLYTRPRKRGKPVYYVRYRKPEGGWTIAQCTGQTSEGAAETFALEQLRAGAVAPGADEVPTFAQWAAGFWDMDGRYDRARRARGYVLSPTYLRIAELTVRKHLSPAFDRLKLTDLTSELLENHFLFPVLAPFCLVVCLVVATISRWVSLASLTAAFVLPAMYLAACAFGAVFDPWRMAFAVAVFLIVVFTHRGNMARLLRGE